VSSFDASLSDNDVRQIEREIWMAKSPQFHRIWSASSESVFSMTFSVVELFLQCGKSLEKFRSELHNVWIPSIVRVSGAFEEEYGDLGGVFCYPQTQKHRFGEMADLDRRISGPVLEVGMVKCKSKRCGSEMTVTIPVQKRSADEPMSFMHRCETCKTEWTT
jgi:hypothetical protein